MWTMGQGAAEKWQEGRQQRKDGSPGGTRSQILDSHCKALLLDWIWSRKETQVSLHFWVSSCNPWVQQYTDWQQSNLIVWAVGEMPT